MRSDDLKFPAYDDLAGIDRDVIFGLITHHAQKVFDATYEYPELRDGRVIDAIEVALLAAARGERSAPSAAPRWLKGLVRRELVAASKEHWSAYWPAERFFRIRLLERLGLVTLEVDETYVLATLSALGPNKLDKSRDDPELVDRAMWRFFEVEGTSKVSLANMGSHGVGGPGDWREVFVNLTTDGTMDRFRVLAECLGALNRDFQPFRANWFAATFLALEPTDDELAALQGQLRSLLGVSVPPFVTLAVKMLIKVQKAGRLEDAETLIGLRATVLIKTKGTAIAALRLAKATGPEHSAAVAELARVAMGHPHPDVQRAAAKLLSDLGDLATVSDLADELTPSVSRDLGLFVRVAEAPEVVWRQRLTPVPSPVTSNDLAERVAALLEDGSDVGELEAALAYLAVSRPGDALAPLRKRAETVAGRTDYSNTPDPWLPGQVARLVLHLLGEPAPPHAYPLLASMRFIAARIAEVQQPGGPLLATPDLEGGWVSAEALVSRLADNPEPRHHDLIAALLRLHPEGRDQFPEAEPPPAVRFALNGEARGERDGPNAWWVAAERSRAPYAEDELPRLAPQNHHNMFFDVITPGSLEIYDDLPTALGHGQPRYTEVRDWVPSLAAVWPHDAEHFLAPTCVNVLNHINWTASPGDAAPVLDALAQHPGRLGLLAANTLAAGLVAGGRGLRLRSVDVFLDLVPTGRLPIELLHAPLTDYWEVRPLNRLTESLRGISQAGAPEVAVQLLTGLLPRLPTNARALNGLLEVLRDETLRHGWSVHDSELRAWLGEHQGSSSAARTARLLLR